MRGRVAALAALIGLGVLASQAQAATLTFDDLIEEPFAHRLIEDGVTIRGNGELGYGGDGAIHLDPYASPAATRVRFSMKSRFDALSFDLTPLGYDYFVCEGKRDCVTRSYRNVKVLGFSGDSVVAELLFKMGEGLSPYTVMLNDGFRGLTSLVIEAVLPRFRDGPRVFADCADVCGHFEIDNVELAPVPLPAGLPLAASGLAALGLIGWRKRRAA
jgi:hypothetical protein